MSIKHRGGMGHIIISSITSEKFRSWCCHVGISHHTKHINISMNFHRILQKCSIKWHTTLFVDFHLPPQGSTNFPNSRHQTGYMKQVPHQELTTVDW